MLLAAARFLSGARLVASSPRGSSPMLGSAILYSPSPFLCCSLSGSASRLRCGAGRSVAVAACFNEARSISGAGYAFPGRYGVSLCFSGAVRCSRLPCHVTQCLCRANSCCAQQSLCFAIIAINASPSLRGEMPFRCVANRATPCPRPSAHCLRPAYLS